MSSIKNYEHITPV